MPVIDRHERLVCSQCGSREIDMVVTDASATWPEGYKLTAARKTRAADVKYKSFSSNVT
jgi:hypothetical protein